MPSLRPLAARLAPLAASAAALALAGCGGPPLDPAPPPPGKAPLRVAAETEPAGRLLVVDATSPRTHVGRFRAGQRVHIEVVDAQWTPAPGPDLFDTRGNGEPCRSSGRHICVGPGAPFMGLVLLTVTEGPEKSVPTGDGCVVQQRIHIPDGAEFTVPVDVELALGPNDWEDGLHNNSGAVTVQVERSKGRDQPAITTWSQSVDARLPKTVLDRFSHGEYVRITVTGGRWNNDPNARMVDSAGVPGETCGAPGHVCVGGEGKPLMGLVLLLSTCTDAPTTTVREPHVERVHIPDGAEVVLEHDADLYLAPNDFEDSFHDNAGSARVRIRTFGP